MSNNEVFNGQVKENLNPAIAENDEIIIASKADILHAKLKLKDINNEIKSRMQLLESMKINVELNRKSMKLMIR